jgi:5'-3' exonuclease
MSNIEYNYVLFVFDSDKESWRTNIYKEYKANRKNVINKVERLTKQLLQEKTMKIISRHFQVFVKPAIEGDDLIWILSQKLSPNFPIIIHTKDKDMFQLISNRISIFDGRDFYSAENFDPTFLKFSKILLGDTSDNIPRVLKKGIGSKKIQAIYKLYGNNIDFINDKKAVQRLRYLTEDKNLSDIDIKRNSDLILLRRQSFDKKVLKELDALVIKSKKTKKNLSILDFISY